MQNLFVVAFLALCIACKESSVKESSSSSSPPPSKPRTVQTKIGPIEVHEGPVPPDAQFMCSADYKTHPMSELHVIPTFNASLGRYVGSYRCNADWQAAIAETRRRIHEHPGEDEVAMLMTVFTERGVTVEELRSYVAGKSLTEAADAVLDALAANKLRLTP